MNKHFMLTSESVTEGHPDKLCDLISDAIVDGFLKNDPSTAITAECAVSTSIVFIAAMFESNIMIDIANLARKVIHGVGYHKKAFNDKTCSIITSIRELPQGKYRHFDENNMSESEIDDMIVKNSVTTFGFACNQTPSFMPLPIWLAHTIARRLTTVRRDNIMSYISPDSKIQVGVEYEDRKPKRVHSIIVQVCQNEADIPPLKQLKEDMREIVLGPVFDSEGIKPDNKTRIFINPDGQSIAGGPALHSGLTGRKKAVDNYGGYSRHTDAALSGKGPLRIDRVGAYMARYAAKNIVAAGIAAECETQISYSIGLSRPVSIQVDTYGTGRVSDEEIADLIKIHFDFRLPAILKKFRLRHLPSKHHGVFYQKLATYGHIGRVDMELPWEATDKICVLTQR